MVATAWFSTLWLLGLLLAREPIAPPPKPIDAQLIEMTSEIPPPQETAAAPTPPPVRKVPRRTQRPVVHEREPAPAPESPSAEPEPEPQPATPNAAPSPPVVSPPSPIAQPSLTAARPVYNPLPTIPDELRDRASTTEALARFAIAADGKVSVELVRPTPDPLLNRAILETLRTWRFAPAMENGKPVASSQVLRIRVEVR
jgi:protein TonB